MAIQKQLPALVARFADLGADPEFAFGESESIKTEEKNNLFFTVGDCYLATRYTFTFTSKAVLIGVRATVYRDGKFHHDDLELHEEECYFYDRDADNL